LQIIGQIFTFDSLGVLSLTHSFGVYLSRN